MAASLRKLDLPIGRLDDWDLLQAAFEGYMEEVQSLPTVDASQILNKEFPSTQNKSAQVQRLKQMLSQRNEWAYSKTSPLYETPQQVLADALTCIQNEKRLSQKKTVRQLLGPYLETSKEVPNARHFQRLPWTQRFRRDFWEYIAALKIKGTDFFPAEAVSKVSPLAPGEQRTLDALKQAAPQGKSVRTVHSYPKRRLG